jgi:hypothetical protein
LNLVKYSRDYTQTSQWLNGGLTVAKNATGYDGTANGACTVTISSGSHALYTVPDPIEVTPLSPYTFAFYAKRGTATDLKYSVTNVTTPSNIVASTSYYAQTNASDFSLIVVNFTAPAACTQVDLYLLRDGGATGTVILDSAAIFQGTLTASQILSEGGIPLTTAAAASNPSAGRYSWGLDGGDSLVISQAAYGISDNFAVFAAATCNNKAAYPFPISAAKSESGNFPIIAGVYFDAAGFASALYRTDAGVDSFYIGPAFTDSTPCVLTHTKQSGFCRTDVNNTLGTPIAAPSGTYTVNQGNIGAALNGTIAQVVVVKGSLTESEILMLKRFTISAIPNGPQF